MLPVRLFTVLDQGQTYHLYLDGTLEGFSPEAKVANWAHDFCQQLVAQIPPEMFVMPTVDMGSMDIYSKKSTGEDFTYEERVQRKMKATPTQILFGNLRILKEKIAHIEDTTIRFELDYYLDAAFSWQPLITHRRRPQGPLCVERLA